MTDERPVCKNDVQDLKELFNAQIAQVNVLIGANDKNYNQRFENVIEATKAALAAADRAVNKAETATEKRFEGVNEFRAQLADQARTLMPRGEYEVVHKSLTEQVASMQKALNDKIDALNLTTISRQSHDTGQKEGIGLVAVVAGIVSAAVAVLSRFIK